MSVFKCKMCGGTIEFESGATVGVCDSCGTKQTLPKTGDDNIANLFNRANNLRLKCEFDKAAAIYEKIVEQDDSEAEAHWGIILCKYGIEYVDDPKTGKKIPTCHRTLFEAVTADADYQAAIDYSDASQQALYEAEAREIDRIQKDILSIVKNEKPFDVFICYKETDENGKRTQDSVIANDIYYQLTQEGFKVFYAAITLEDKLGREYEPYIFAALNSAKVMLVVGTNPMYFNSVWVRNEWSRYLALMKTDRSKLLIPCYRDMDAYELPEEFAHLQAQDMSKIGFINDVVRGIKKVVSDKQPAKAAEDNIVVNNVLTTNETPLLKRAFLFLEDGKFDSADEYCEKVLDINPENAEAYLVKLLIELQIKTRQQLADCEEPFDGSENYNKVIRFGDERLKTEIQGYAEHINKRIEIKRKNKIYSEAESAIKSFANEKEGNRIAIEKFKLIPGWKDADERVIACQKAIEAKEEADRLERERRAEEQCIVAEKAAKKRKKFFMIATPIVCVIIAFIIVLTTVIIPKIKSSNMKDYALATVGDHIYFGEYEQDNRTSNGKENIEWIVLAKEDNKILVISDKALDCQKYNAVDLDVTWESCSLRAWLNDTFLNAAFSAEEQSQILSTTVSADKNPKYSTNPGNTTTDKVFLLSITDAEKYFSSNEDRKCVPTAYAKSQGASVSETNKNDGGATCWWWLRSPGYSSNKAAYVFSAGSLYSFGGSVHTDIYCVRPAMWINQES